jgi:hypothetical protein
LDDRRGLAKTKLARGSRPRFRIASRLGAASVLGCALAACTSRPAASAGESEHACKTRHADFVRFVEALPEAPPAASIGVELPRSSLGGFPGNGPILEVSPSTTSIDGRAIEGGSVAERARAFGTYFHAASPAPSDSGSDGGGAPARGGASTLYVAATANTDVATLRAHLVQVPEATAIKLLFRSKGSVAGDASGATEDARRLALALLAEPEPTIRRERAEHGYAAYSRCDAVARAVASVRELGAGERWPALQNALISALPACSCDTLDTASLRLVLAAEQRAGTMTLGSMPLTFLRDARCGASMPKRSVEKLLRQVEDFETEFAGDWQKDALAFDEVVTDDRLLVYFCDALPGETLASLQRARATLHWRVAASEPCQAWHFEPLSPGAPMGTWKRSGNGEELSFHYWQAAEEIRLFGPAETRPASVPTDERKWACDENHRMLGIDARSIELEAGRWFFSERACNDAPAASSRLSGCVGDRAAGRSDAKQAGEDAVVPGIP